MLDDQDHKHHREKEEKPISTANMLRDTSGHYIRLIGDADRKARIMIVVNSILLTITATVLTGSLRHEAPIWISALILMLANLVTLFFSIISVKPEIQNHLGRETENNMLHYKKCSEFSLSDYKYELLQSLETNSQKLDALVKYMYFFGNLLNKKYKLLKIAYRAFYWGLTIAVISYVIIAISYRSHFSF